MTDTSLFVPELIVAKRDGHALSDAHIRALVAAYAAGDLPDAQMAALAMAIYFRGLDDRETATWTEAMLRSGRVLDLGDLGKPIVDKHSTGGVGDKVSLVLAPIAAAAGLLVPMVSGRGLGHTGGTIDKLEAIPGFRADLSEAELRRVLADVGCAIVGATSDIAPADKRLYALRDVTATVPSIPLIVSSIMSKKLAEGLSALLLDVKVGRAAFMPTLGAARELARGMIAVGERMGVRTRALITRMDEPLGIMVGNADEVREAIACLEGHGDPTLTDLSVEQAAEMIAMGLGVDLDGARVRARAALDSGRAREIFGKMVRTQGGDLSRLPEPPGETVVRADRDGHVVAIDGLEVALALVGLGAGRQRAGDPIDPTVGLRIEAHVGASVCPGAPLFTVRHGAAGAPDPRALARLRAAWTLADEPAARAPLVVERLSRDGVVR
ncbi:MAG: thymidine phosphorylase [Deltaproteobacteria bacterium]|nr:thymidine phosphorylase [Deltaproteobacteria bacterium]